jgi:hypothetical protein
LGIVEKTEFSPNLGISHADDLVRLAINVCQISRRSMGLRASIPAGKKAWRPTRTYTTLA